MMHRLLLGAIAAFGCLATAADVVQLANGDRLTGTVLSVERHKLVIETEYAGAVAVKVDAIASVETDGPLTFELIGEKDEQTGRLIASPDGQTLEVQGAGGKKTVRPLVLADVGRAAQGRAARVFGGASWDSRADLSAVVSSGNTDTQSYNTLVESKYEGGPWQHSFSVLVSNEEADEQTTKDQLDIDYAFRRLMNDHLYIAGNGEYFTDEVKDIDQRITIGAGLGYQFWDDTLSALSTELGVSAVFEELADDNETNPALRWGLDYRRWLLDRKLEFFHNQSVLVIPDSDRGEVLESSTGLRYVINSRIDAAVRADVNHETEPQPGNSATDVTYTLGVGIKF